jgi:hypothetical protein
VHLPVALTFTPRTRTCIPRPDSDSNRTLDYLRIASFTEPADLPFPNDYTFDSHVLRAPQGLPEYEPYLVFPDSAKSAAGQEQERPSAVVHPSFSWRPKTTRRPVAELPSPRMGNSGLPMPQRPNVRYQAPPRAEPIPSPTTIFQLFGDGLERLMYRAPSASLRTSETTGEPILGR